MAQPEIRTLLAENRTFPPPARFAAQARIRSLQDYRQLYRRSLDDPEGFWSEIAAELHWFRRWERVLDWQPPQARWFEGGLTNLSYNCLDRHLGGPRREQPAIVWEGEPGDVRTLSFAELHAEVMRFANALKDLGVRKGDRVCIYMPMVPEAAVAMLACARIGAPHSVVFGGFAAHALGDRIRDAQARVVVTADGGWRRGKAVELKAAVDEAVAEAPSVESVVVLKRTGTPVRMQPGRDHWWHELTERAAAECPAEPLEAEHPLFILYTSGTTGRPKGIVHTTGGYMVGTYLTARTVFDLREDDLFWCTADVGWVTGHSYVVYGILANGVSTLMYEGAPNHPGPDRFWQIVARHRVTVFYTAPTAIRAFMKWGDEHPRAHDLSSLRLLGTVGEPINPEAWMWYHRVIGGERCPIVDTWWQTETGAIMIAPLPGAVPTRAGQRHAASVRGRARRGGRARPQRAAAWRGLPRDPPAVALHAARDLRRCGAVSRHVLVRFPGMYFTGDGARRDADGYYWLLGRVDDVLNVAGHRLGTAEIESALVSHPAVAEAAVVGYPHPERGEGIAAFVTLRAGAEPAAELGEELRQHVAQQIGPIARPDQVHLVEALPKTRSGKIMRRLLREIASGREQLGDTTTLEDHTVLERLRAAAESAEG
ncbi:MAG: acetyl-coenzyme A synthetase [Planctomycetota bacterium]|nr:MAG: acetyl-coenzyme A synthetase [Planctomycetota bacterium]